MPSVKYSDNVDRQPSMGVREGDIEDAFTEKLRSLKYTIRPDIRDRAALEQNFREKFEALNRVNLTNGEFQRLLDQIITPDVFTAARTLLCFLQLFIVSNRTDTWYFANNNARHFSFNAEERFLPVYQFAAEDNSKITHLDLFAEKFLAKCTLGQMVSLQRRIFDGEKLTDLMQPLGLNWKARRVAELALMDDLVPLLKKRAQGREISGLSAYEP